MNIKLQYAILSILSILIIVAGFLLYFQQRSITDLKEIISEVKENQASAPNRNDNFVDVSVSHPYVDNNNNSNLSPSPAASDINEVETEIQEPPAPNNKSFEEEKKEVADLIPKISDMAGKIQEIGSDLIFVEAEIIDLSKFNKDEFIKTDYIAPKVVKKFKVMIDKNTVFTNKKINEFKVGDYIRAFSNDPIYNISEFTATNITYLDEEAVSMIKAE